MSLKQIYKLRQNTPIATSADFHKECSEALRIAACELLYYLKDIMPFGIELSGKDRCILYIKCYQKSLENFDIYPLHMQSKHTPPNSGRQNESQL